MPTLDPILHTLALMAPSGYFIGLHIRYASPLMQFSNYDQNWLDHYTEKAYALRDPTIAWGFSQEGACRWDEMGVPDPFGLFTEAKSFGLTYGLTVSCGPIRSRTISSFARSDRDFLDDEIDKIDKKLANPQFVEKAPPEVIDEQRERRADAVARLERLQAALARLS